MVFADEFTVSLVGRVVRVWAPVGEEVRQRLHVGWDSAHAALAIDPITGTIEWQWFNRGHRDRKHRARAACSRRSVGAPEEPPELVGWLERLAEVGVRGVVWDGGRAHRDRAVCQHANERELVLVEQPPASPELNPAERVIEVIRRATEGRLFTTLESKLTAVEGVLNELALDPERVRQLTRWDWILDNLRSLPP